MFVVSVPSIPNIRDFLRKAEPFVSFRPGCRQLLAATCGILQPRVIAAEDVSHCIEIAAPRWTVVRPKRPRACLDVVGNCQLLWRRMVIRVVPTASEWASVGGQLCQQSSTGRLGIRQILNGCGCRRCFAGRRSDGAANCVVEISVMTPGRHDGKGRQLDHRLCQRWCFLLAAREQVYDPVKLFL